MACVRLCMASSALTCHCFDRGDGSLWVEIVSRAGRVHGLGVELKTERDAGRDVESDDFLIGQPIEVLLQGTQRVAVGDHHTTRSRRRSGTIASYQ